MKCNENGTGAEKEQCFKEGVSKQMEHGSFARRETHRHDHVAELRKRGVSQDAFDVVLLRGDEGGHDCCDCANPCDNAERVR